jgi:peptidoglycan/LPS O-acetylase OafA/YrhL
MAEDRVGRDGSSAIDVLRPNDPAGQEGGDPAPARDSHRHGGRDRRAQATGEVAAHTRARPSATGDRRVPALDGVRALALIVTMGYHFGVGWLSGGFFGLDIFFVLSGFLITGLLLSEYRHRGRIRLPLFWARRARRLLPALVVVLVVLTLVIRFAEPAGLYPDFRMSAFSALFYFSNWWQIAVSTNYFVATGAVSPLTHTWSLAVEEQFYLVWPIIVIGVLHLSRTFARGVRVLLAVGAIGAVASAVEMGLLYSPAANITRLYFGADTHAQSILIGSTLACALTIVQLRRGQDGMAPPARARSARTLLSVVALAGLAGLFLLVCTQNGYSAFDYRGGFFLAGLSAAAIILGSVCVPGGLIARIMSLRPLVLLGTISYGAYLWHYPIYVFVDSERVGFAGLGLLALRFALTIAVATASYVLVERPVMEGTLWRSVRSLGWAAAAIVATVAVIVAGTLAPAAAAASPVGRYHPVGALRPPPVLVVLGDSTALTLSYALNATAPVGTKVVDGALFGCGLAIGSYIAAAPGDPQLPFGPNCRESSPTSELWPAVDARTVSRTGPGDVVFFMAGTWETIDELSHGRWTNITEPSFQRYLLAQMRKAVAIGTAKGAHFDFTEMAANHSSGTPNDTMKRRLLYDSLVRKVAAEFPNKVSVIDFGQIVSPGGVFTQFLDGVRVRTIDGVHTPSYARGNAFVSNSTEAVANAFYNWLSPRIWPQILATTPQPHPS